MIGFIVGLFVGAAFGMGIAAIMVCARDADDTIRDLPARWRA
jgi:hypothetical protein